MGHALLAALDIDAPGIDLVRTITNPTVQMRKLRVHKTDLSKELQGDYRARI